MNSNKPIHVILKFPDDNDVHFDIQEPNTISCITGIKLQPVVYWYTNGQFATKNGPLLNSGTDLSSEVQNGTLILNYIPNEYDLHTALNHAQQTSRIIFSLTSHPELADCHQSVVAFLTRTYGIVNSGKKVPTEQDYADYFPTSFLNTSIPKLVKYFDILENSNLSNSGIFIKFKLITKEKKEFIIDSTKEGFYISSNDNPSQNKIYSNLYRLFCDVSLYFKENSALVAGRWVALDKLERIPYEPLNKQHVLSVSQKNELPQLRIFNVNKEIITGSIEDEIDKIEDDNQLKCYICVNIEEQYVKQICDFVKLIDSNVIQVDGDGYYRHNDIKLRKIKDINEYRTYSNYIRIIDELKASMKDVKIIRPIIVEFFGQLYIVLPHEENTTKSDFVNDSFSKQFCQIFSCNEVPKGVKGYIDDNGTPAITFVPYATPHDSNFDNDEFYVFRYDILRSFEIRKQLTLHSEELKSLGGDEKSDFMPFNNDIQKVDEETKEKVAKLIKRRTEIINEAQRPIYNININDSLSKEVSEFILNNTIPSFVNLFMSSVNCQIDGNYIVEKMHSCGLNVRYLGKILEFIKKDDSRPMNQAFILTIESEIIIRSYKYIVRSQNLPIDRIINDINTLTSSLNHEDETFDKIFNEICEIAFKKFHVRPSKPINDQFPYIKIGMLINFGIIIGTNNQDSTSNNKNVNNKPINVIENLKLTITDITNVNPKVKFNFTKNQKYVNTIKHALKAYNNDDLSTAFQLYQVAIQLSEQSVIRFDESLIDCHFYCALIYYRTKQLGAAYQAMMQATIMHERHTGYYDTSLIFKYSLLGSIAAEFENKRLALALFARCAALIETITPFHPWIIEALTDAADAAASLDSNMALKFALNALELCKKNSKSTAMLANAHATVAMIALAGDKIPLASKYADEAMKLNPANQDYKGLRAQILIKQARVQHKRGGRR